VILKAIEHLRSGAVGSGRGADAGSGGDANGPPRAARAVAVGAQLKVGVVKFDCLATSDDEVYERHGVPVRKGLSGALCPDHYFVSNVEEVVQRGIQHGLDLLISESAGLCNRCSPYVKEVLAVCVIDNLSGVGTPRKIGPMLKSAAGILRQCLFSRIKVRVRPFPGQASRSKLPRWHLACCTRRV
jgi:hypothetical protein